MMKTSVVVIFLLSICASEARTVYRSLQPYDIPVKVVYDEQIAFTNRDIKDVKPQKVSEKEPVVVPEVTAEKTSESTKYVVSYDEVKNVVKVEEVDSKKDHVPESKPHESEEVLKVVPAAEETPQVEVVGESNDVKEVEDVKDKEETNSLRNSESHPAQIPNLKSQTNNNEVDLELLKAESGDDTSAKPPANSTFVNFQQSITNVIESIRPSNVVQAVVDRFSNRNSTNQTEGNNTLSGFQQTISNAFEMIRPSNVVQAVVDRFSNRTNQTNGENSNGTFANIQQSISNAFETYRPAHVVQAVVDRFSNRTNQTNGENSNGTFSNFQQSISNAFETIRPVNVVQAVVDRFSNNKNNSDNKAPENSNSTPSNSTFSNIQHAISNAIESVRPVNVIQAVVDRFSNRNNNTNSTEQKGMDTVDNSVSSDTVPTNSPNYVQNLYTGVNKTIANFRDSVNNAFNEVKPTRAPGDAASPSRPVLESIQSNFNASLNTFVNNIDKLFANFQNSNDSSSPSFFQTLTNGIQSSLSTFAQSIIPNYSGNNDGTQSDTPVNSFQQVISSGFQTLVGNLNQVFSTNNNQNDESSNGPFQVIGNVFNSIFRPNTLGDTETSSPSSFSPVQALQSGFQTLVSVFRPSQNDGTVQDATGVVSDGSSVPAAPIVPEVSATENQVATKTNEVVGKVNVVEEKDE